MPLAVAEPDSPPPPVGRDDHHHGIVVGGAAAPTSTPPGGGRRARSNSMPSSLMMVPAAAAVGGTTTTTTSTLGVTRVDHESFATTPAMHGREWDGPEKRSRMRMAAPGSGSSASASASTSPNSASPPEPPTTKQHKSGGWDDDDEGETLDAAKDRYADQYSEGDDPELVELAENHQNQQHHHQPEFRYQDPTFASKWETDAERVAFRQRQIDKGKDTVGYRNYVELVPKWKRTREHPRTPDPRLAMSKRAFEGRVRQWRRLLHQYDVRPGEENMVRLDVRAAALEAAGVVVPVSATVPAPHEDDEELRRVAKEIEFRQANPEAGLVGEKAKPPATHAERDIFDDFEGL